MRKEKVCNIGAHDPGVILVRSAETLTQCFLAGVDAVRPDRCLPRALADGAPWRRPAAVLAVGKAAAGMASTLRACLVTDGAAVVSTFVAGAHHVPGAIAGEHPVPGAGSAGVAERLGTWIDALPLSLDVHVALSGGASAIMAGPLPGLRADDVHVTFQRLLGSGLDIAAMNAVRKRVTRWSAGRLALALAPRRVFTWIISDVPGDDLATIGSGPCTADPWSAGMVIDLLRARGLEETLPAAVRAALGHETPKPGPAFAHVTQRIVATNRDALEASAAWARERGMTVRLFADALRGEAVDAGRRLAAHAMRAPHDDAPRLELHGGETTVTLGRASAAGGRNQELALAAAIELGRHPTPHLTLLAAGTDGRDGTTDVAGAIVDGGTHARLLEAGVDPTAALARHAAHDALRAVDALLTTGPTGTNVMDMVLVLREPRAQPD